MLACEIRRIQWKTWTHFLLSFLFDKDVYKFPFFLFFVLTILTPNQRADWTISTYFPFTERG